MKRCRKYCISNCCISCLNFSDSARKGHASPPSEGEKRFFPEIFGIYYLTLPYRCSVSATTLETTIRHSFLSIAFLAQSLMPIPAYLETLSTQLVLFLPRPLVPSTIPSTNDFCMAFIVPWKSYSSPLIGRVGPPSVNFWRHPCSILPCTIYDWLI